MPDTIPRFDDWVKTVKLRRYDENSALDLIAQYESGNRNVKQQVVPPGGGYNPSVGRVTGPSTASGPWQITDTTWRKRAPRDIAQKYPSAISAPVEVQRAVAGKIYRETGFQDWEPYNASLRRAIARGEQPRSQSPAEIPKFDEWVAGQETAQPQPTATPQPDAVEALTRLTRSIDQNMNRAIAKSQRPTRSVTVDRRPASAGPANPFDLQRPGKLEVGGKVPEVPRAFSARTPSTWESIKEAVAPYVPGLTSIDTPGGIKTDLPRGIVRGLTLGAVGDEREITAEEKLLNPQAGQPLSTGYVPVVKHLVGTPSKIGESATAFLPYVGAAKLAGKVPALARAGRTAAAGRTALTFGGVSAAREGINAVKTGEPIRPDEIAVSTAIGAAMGAIPGVNAGLKQRVVAAVVPQVVADVARGVPLEQAAQGVVTNLLFEFAAGRKKTESQAQAETPEVLTRPERTVDERPAFVRAGRQLGERTGQFVGDAEVSASPNQQGVKTGYTRVLRHQDGGQQIVKNDVIIEKPTVTIKGVEDTGSSPALTRESKIELPKTQFVPNVGEVVESPNQQGVKKTHVRVTINGAQRIVPRSSIIEGYKVRDAKLGETDYTVVRDFEGKESFLPTTAVHQSAFQARRVRGEGKGQFKKGAVVPGPPEAAGEVVAETASTPEIKPVEVKTQASIEPPLTRAALQVPAPRAAERPSLTLVRNQAERSFPRSAEAAGLPGGENRTYDPITNEESLAKADKRIAQVGVDRAANEIAFRREATPDDIATGIRLMQTFTKAGQHERAAEVAGDLAEKLTKAGQSVQAATIISRLSPEGVLLTAQRQLPEGKKLTAAQSEALTGQAKTVQEADARIADLESQIAKMQVGVSSKKASKPKLSEKIGTLEDRLVKMESEARARLEARKQSLQGNKLGSQAGASVIPLDIADLSIIGAAKIARKGMSTAKWTAEMLSEFGEGIRPELRKVYQQSYSLYNEQRKQMQSESQERSIKRENPTVTDPKALNDLIEQRATARKDARTARAEMARLFSDLSAAPLTRVKTAVGDVLNAPRTLKSSVDLSAPRQGAMWMLNHPIQGTKLFFGKQLKAMREVNYDRFVDELESDPDYALMVRSKLALTTTDNRPNTLTGREEAFMSRLAGSLPGVKHSERAYTTFMDTARSSWFKQLKSVAEMKAQKEGRQLATKDYEAIANFVNIATGRGNLGKGWLNETSPFLNAMFFAPKFAVSKVQIFDPRVYARMPKGARAGAMREAATYFGAMASTAVMLKFGLGLEVGLNPEESDFMKLRIGNTRYDLANGTGQYIVLATRLLRNAENKRTGKKDKFGRSFMDNLDRFARYKYSPPAGFTRNVWEGKNPIGEKTDAKTEAAKLVSPLFLNELYDAYKEEGLTGVGMTAPGFVGVGTSTYGDKKKK